MVKLKNLGLGADLEMQLVEVTGVEPVSVIAFDKTPTSVVSVKNLPWSNAETQKP